MKGSNLVQGEFYAVACNGSRPADGCQRMIYVMPWAKKHVFLDADEDDEWTPEEALRAAQGEEHKITYGSQQPDANGWLVGERAVASTWEGYTTWQVDHAYRSAAAVRAHEMKRLKEIEDYKAKQAAEEAAKLATPLGQMEQKLESYIGVRSAHLTQSLKDEEFDPDERVGLYLSIRFKNWKAVEQFVGRLEQHGLLKVKLPVIDTQAEEEEL